MFKQHANVKVILILIALLTIGGLSVLAGVNGAPSGIYYIAPDGNDANPGTEAQPWRTIQKATNTLQPGETVLVKNGVYDTVLHSGWAIEINRSGRPDAWISYKAYPGHRPKITSPAWAAFRIHNGASYIEISGFELEGIPSAVSNYSGGGIAMSGAAHHIRVLNNIVHGFGGGGIETLGVDYIHIEGNVVYNNAFGSIYGQSGISLYQNYNHDAAPGYHNIIRGNIGYDNRNTKPQQSSGTIADGNCIIIDDGRHTYSSVYVAPYTGATLIENNVCYNNGGRGIHVFLSDNVDVFNNTLFSNVRSPEMAGAGELSAIKASNVRMFNNIVYAAAGAKGNYTSTVSNVTFGHNLYFNTTDIMTSGTNDLIGVDPRFMNPSTNPASADFRLRQESPAIDRSGGGYFPAIDAALAARPSGAAADLGAFEFITSIRPTATVVPPTVTPKPPTATFVPPTATVKPPTATATLKPPTATATVVPPTATRIPPTATQIPPTATSVPPSATPIPPTATVVPPTATMVPTSTWTPVPPTSVPTLPPTPSGPSLQVLVSPTTAQFGQQISVELRLSNVSMVYAMQADCQVDPTVLLGTTRTDGTIFTPGNSFIVDNGFQVDGRWRVAASLLNPAPAFIGTGAAFTLNFLVAGPGSTTVSCTTLAVDANGNETPVTITAGSFSGEGASLADPNLVNNPNLVANPSANVNPTLPAATLFAPTAVPAATTVPSVGNVSGTAVMERRTDQSGIHVRFIAGNSSLAELDTGADGRFTFTDVPVGNYVIEVSAPGHLTLYYAFNATGEQGVQTGVLTLLAGDVDRSGEIDLADASLIGANFGIQSPPVPGDADFYNDGLINLVDLVLVGKNFGKSVVMPGS